jgi:polar amino acid transport system substrate-binding protein
MMPARPTDKGEKTMHAIQSLPAVLLALLAAVSLPAAAAGTFDQVKRSGEIRLGYGSDDRPFSYRDDAGKPAGFAIDLCTRVAEALNAKPVFVPVARAERADAIAQGKIQLLCDPTVPTIESRARVSYPIPVFASGAVAAVRASSAQRLKDILSGVRPPNEPNWRANADQYLRRTTFSFVTHTHTEDQVRSRMEELRLQVKTLPVESYADGLKSLRDGRSDVLFGDRAVLLDAVKRGGGSDVQVLDRLFTFEPLALALPRNDDDFRLAVDGALSRVYHSEGFRSLYTKWFGPPNERALMFFGLAALPD